MFTSAAVVATISYKRGSLVAKNCYVVVVHVRNSSQTFPCQGFEFPTCLSLFRKTSMSCHGFGGKIDEHKRKLYCFFFFFLFVHTNKRSFHPLCVHYQYNFQRNPLFVILCLHLIHFCLTIIYFLQNITETNITKMRKKIYKITNKPHESQTYFKNLKTTSRNTTN